MATVSSLRLRMIEDMTLRNLSAATQQSYLYAVARFSRHFGRSPDRLGMEEVRSYQLHLVAQKLSWSHINQVACALRFFYAVTLGNKEAFERIVYGREPEKLPPVLDAGEIVRFLESVAGLRNRVALTTAYAAGLRIGEVAGLKVAAIDSKRMLIHVVNAKGGKDRYAMLSPRLLEILRAYWRVARPAVWLFPGQAPISWPWPPNGPLGERCHERPPLLSVAAGVFLPPSHGQATQCHVGNDRQLWRCPSHADPVCGRSGQMWSADKRK